VVSFNHILSEEDECVQRTTAKYDSASPSYYPILAWIIGLSALMPLMATSDWSFSSIQYHLACKYSWGV